MRRYLFLILISLLAGSRLSAQGVSASCACNCLKPLFDYLVVSHRLFTKESDHVLISSLISDANSAGYPVTSAGCSILSKNLNEYFYAVTTAETGTMYKARVGDCSVVLTSMAGSISFYQLAGTECRGTSDIYFSNNQVIKKRFPVTRSMNVSYVRLPSDVLPDGPYPYYYKDTASVSISSGQDTKLSYYSRSVFAADGLVSVPAAATILSASIHLLANPNGYAYPGFPNAHTTLEEDGHNGSGLLMLMSSPWSYANSAENVPITYQFAPMGFKIGMDGHFDNLDHDITDWMKNNRTQMEYGFVLDNRSLSLTDDQRLTFCSEKYPDPERRPYVEVSYVTNKDTTTVAKLTIDSCYTCTTVPSGFCYSAVTDTSVNPILYGINGNWRAYRSYAYYGDRSETDPLKATDIRKDGTLKDFSMFWKHGVNGWQSQKDTTRWVWNSEVTLHNRRGIELENKDPLGRYTAGLFGYDEALPIAVVQNARYREAAFEGFEDYYFGGIPCDVACAATRRFDFSSYKNNLDTLQSHTGRYSLRIAAGNSAGISATILPDTDTLFGLAFNTAAAGCNGNAQVLKSIKAGKDALLPPFSPLTGKKIVISAWAKEAVTCKGDTYTDNQISIVLGRAAGNITLIAKPTGGIIEGWQRYEAVVDLPADMTMLTVNMQATGSSTVYFDDLRIHPYNANMKSFVYDPVTLRLMAELDENNYSTLYEYDDDGTLVRLKKETERGIKTITETRSALLKE